ncbi:MAG: glycosyltransferase [Oscillospiraceae bacterium]|nr:glycosyltransferase [Oscillospiraceae bacterium]
MKVRDIIANNSEWMPNTRYETINPLVTVILPTYSRAKSGLLRQSIDSVLNQSFRRLELIIIDDGSVDGTFDICKKYMRRDPRVSIIRHKENMGLPAVSTYEAYMKARGEYIAYAFDDNQWELDALSKTYDFMEENQVKASYGITRVTDPITHQTVELGTDGTMVSASIWMGNCIGAGSVVLHKEVLETVGLHDPHLSLTRVCDWDLWLRIIEYYEFVATDILFTFEHGTTQPDSLGNMFKLDQWFFREWQQNRKKSNLLPAVYESFDVIECEENNSTYFKTCLKVHYLQYKKKYWFSSTELDKILTMRSNSTRKRILVLVSETNASYMSFTRYKGKNCTFAYLRGDTVTVTLLALTDVVIFGRLFWAGTNVKELCEALSIPYYYYTDDNFRECALESNDRGISSLARDTTAENLKAFQGVIVSCNMLKDYFIKKRLHRNVIVLDPIYRDYIAHKREDNTFTVGFMGGKFREGVLRSCILPALLELSENRKIRLICPCMKGEEENLKDLEKRKLEIIPFVRTHNYEYLLNMYQKIGIDVLIHCGRNLRNNIYKTKNALINAVTLGVPLVVSDIEPYCYREADEFEENYIIIRNTKENWKSTLQKLADSPQLRHKYFETAREFCSKRYSSRRAWTELEKEFEQYLYHEDFFYLKRYERLCEWIQVHGLTDRKQAINPTWRQYIPEKLSYTGEMKLPRRFGFTSHVACIREIGLLFAVTGECSGTVSIGIYKKGHRAPENEWKISIDQLTKDGYTNFYLVDSIIVKRNELLYLDIDIEYEYKNGYVGLFEDRKRRTFWYKVLNKLGHPLCGKNALFVDCRS